MYHPATRKEALLHGWPRYMTWKTCVRNHLDARYTSTGQCISCISIYQKEWKEENKDWFPEHNRSYARSRHWQNRDKLNQETREWRLKNPEKQKELNRNWHLKNPEARRVHENTRRTRLKKASGSHTIKQIREMMVNQKCECVYCHVNIKNNYQIDHIIPVSRGGSGNIGNIQLLCIDCNQSKHNKMPKDFLLALTKEGRLK